VYEVGSAVGYALAVVALCTWLWLHGYALGEKHARQDIRWDMVDLHDPIGDEDGLSCWECGKAWPCPTMQAMEARPA
jgi:hypothetical protein